MKIGVFICHCGSNIAGTVDCAKVAEIAKTYPDVAFSTDTMYTCSEPGQEEIVAAIKEHKLDAWSSLPVRRACTSPPSAAPWNAPGSTSIC